MPARLHVRQLREDFQHRFGRPPAVVTRAPGRVNLIGEHTDYNDGFVLPMALEQSTWVAAALRSDGQMRVVACDLEDERTWPATSWHPGAYPHWTSYVAGSTALLACRSAGEDLSPVLSGCDLLIRSEVPVGGGLSSSAALEVATALALSRLCGVALAGVELADFCRQVEHEFAGVPCGIMDQYVSVLARAGCAFLLDCRHRTWEHIPLRLSDHLVVVVDSGVRHELAAGEYALRQRQCQQAVEYFRARLPDVRALRDLEVDVVQRYASQMDPTVAARALHVTSENRRTCQAADALRRGDLRELGRLMHASHISLRDGYQVSCRELDLLVDILQATTGVLGARMTGGGFGGCVVAIAARDSLVRIEQAIRERYDGVGYGPARILCTRPGPGASIELG